MLILTRKIDQGIVISGNILVRVLGVERDRVKIGISAPLEVTVLRQELLEGKGKAPRGMAEDPGGNNAARRDSSAVPSQEGPSVGSA